MKYFFVCFLILASIGGCSANHWGGEVAGEYPGIHFKKNFITGTEFTMTANAGTEVESIEFTRDKGGDINSIRLTVKGLKYNQAVSDVMDKAPAQLEAIANLQRVQVEYITVVMNALKEMVESMVPALTLSEQLIKVMDKAIDKTDVVFPTSQPVK